jgi:hypothetical protein
MTLTEYEQALLPLPSFQRFPAAGAAQKLRQLVADGETFAGARDRVTNMRQYRDPLTDTGQLTAFAALTGP